MQWAVPAWVERLHCLENAMVSSIPPLTLKQMQATPAAWGVFYLLAYPVWYSVYAGLLRLLGLGLRLTVFCNLFWFGAYFKGNEGVAVSQHVIIFAGQDPGLRFSICSQELCGLWGINWIFLVQAFVTFISGLVKDESAMACSKLVSSVKEELSSTLSDYSISSTAAASSVFEEVLHGKVTEVASGAHVILSSKFG